jgi:hypothetical protein
MVKTIIWVWVITLCATLFGELASADKWSDQNPKAGQWKSVGGEMLLSGNHEFNESWISSSFHIKKGLYWQGNFYDKEEDRNYQPWDDTVKNAVSPLKGQITVMGPCNVGLYQRKTGAMISLTNIETNKGFSPWGNTITRYNEKDNWRGTVKEFNPNGEFWGFIPKDTEITLDVYAVMSAYDNMMNTGEFSYRAPQDVEYEIWFFPRGEGCKVLNVNTMTSDLNKPQPGILYYRIKECN